MSVQAFCSCISILFHSLPITQFQNCLQNLDICYNNTPLSDNFCLSWVAMEAGKSKIKTLERSVFGDNPENDSFNITCIQASIPPHLPLNTRVYSSHCLCTHRAGVFWMSQPSIMREIFITGHLGIALEGFPILIHFLSIVQVKLKLLNSFGFKNLHYCIQSESFHDILLLEFHSIIISHCL